MNKRRVMVFGIAYKVELRPVSVHRCCRCAWSGQPAI